MEFNITQMKSNNILDEYNWFFVKIRTQNTLFFDENIHRPSTLLLHSDIEVKIIDSFGDYGALIILSSIWSGEKNSSRNQKTHITIYNFFNKNLWYCLDILSSTLALCDACVQNLIVWCLKSFDKHVFFLIYWSEIIFQT